AGVDRLAGPALAARVGTGATLAAQAHAEDPRAGGLTAAAGAGKQVGVVHAARIDRGGQRGDPGLLPDQCGETLRAPPSGEDEVGPGLHSATPRRAIRAAAMRRFDRRRMRERSVAHDAPWRPCPAAPLLVPAARHG